MRTVKVNLGDRSYSISISSGLLDEIGRLARNVVGQSARRAVIVTNPRVESIAGARVVRSLSLAGFKIHRFRIGDGERFKSLKTAEELFSFLIEQRIERSDLIIALGGGVVGDLAGFAAATYLRGVRLVQIPTTLLAQIDSSVGGKTAVNHRLGKNLIGAFHQPCLVAIDPDTLRTLAARQIQAGLYEVIKYGVIRDRRFFSRVIENLEEIKRLDSSELELLIARCCAIKAGVVENDEREGGLRRILNFGHTVGHALEAVTHYRRFLHGEAVGYGMRAASRIAERMELLTPTDREEIESAIIRVGRLPKSDSLAFDDIISAMHRDKKVEAGRATFVLPVEIGKVVIRSDVPPKIVRQALKETLA